VIVSSKATNEDGFNAEVRAHRHLLQRPNEKSVIDLVSGLLPSKIVARISVGDNKAESLSETVLSAVYFEFPVVGRQQKVGQAFRQPPLSF
jgi:hypothetical protein